MALAFKKDWPESMADLLGRGYRVNTKDEVSGSTALHLTALANRPGNARVLLENGAKRDIKCDNGEGGKHTAAEFAKSEGKKKFASYLSGARRAPSRRRRRRRRRDS